MMLMYMMYMIYVLYIYLNIGLNTLNLENQEASSTYKAARNGGFYYYESNKKYLSIRTEDRVNWTKKKGESCRLQETFQMIKVNNLEMIKGDGDDVVVVDDDDSDNDNDDLDDDHHHDDTISHLSYLYDVIFIYGGCYSCICDFS